MIRFATALCALALIAACSASDPTGDSGENGTPSTASSAPSSATPTDLLLPLPTSTSAAISGADIASRIETLADDRFEGRAPGTDTGEASARWIAAEMARIGLQPGADDGTYLQPVDMAEVTLDVENSGLAISNGDSKTQMNLGTDAVIWSKRQTQTPLSFEDSEVVFVGYGVVAPEYGWDDYAGLDVEGKTVVILVNDPGYANPDGELFNGRAMTYYGRWTYKYEEAARQGATAAIVVHETAPASYGWDVVSNSWSGGQRDLVRPDAGEDRAILEAWVSNDMARQLFDQAGLNFDRLKDAAGTSGFTYVEMGNLTASGAISQRLRRLQSHNVVGVIPGNTRPDEYMLYVGHWDHLGKKLSDHTNPPSADGDEDLIFNGAVDNASGTAVILEVAEAMMAEDLERSVLFVSVTLEESGLLGSAYYAENPTVPLNQVVAGINIDAVLPIGKTNDIVVVGYGASELEDRLKVIADADNRTIVPDPKPEAGYFYRSDHVSFAKKGVPMLYADAGLDKVEGGVAAGQAFADLYTVERYHKPADEYDPSWDMSGIEQEVQTLFTLGRDLANSNDWPEWYVGNEFKAIRDASRSTAD
ncbi:MAG: M28 family metallopeptidase [Hyphomonadaceae bacterium]